MLDCYVEELKLSSTIPTWDNKIWYSTDKTNVSVSEPSKINCITTKNVDPGVYTIANCTDGQLKYYDGGGSTQLKAEH